MSSPTLVEEQQTHVLDNDSHKQLLEEVKTQITQLPAEIQAALDEARASQGTTPEPANAAEDQLERGSFLTDMNTFDTHSIAKIISDLSNGNIFESVNAKSDNTALAFPMSVNAMDSVRTESNERGGGGVFSVFGSNMAEHTMRISTESDDTGRDFHDFDNGVNSNISVVVFETKDIRMVKINNTILPFNTLLSLKTCVNLPYIEKKEGRMTLRRPTQYFQNGVECRFDNDMTLDIPHISVYSMMSIISHLSQVYTPSAVQFTDSLSTSVSAANQTESWMTPWAKDILIHTGVNVLCALGGYLLGLNRC